MKLGGGVWGVMVGGIPPIRTPLICTSSLMVCLLSFSFPSIFLSPTHLPLPPPKKGHEYKQALSDFTQISGKIAMVPQHLTGIWWTRWTNLNSADVKKIVNDYRSHSLPLDVFVLDMDWHYKEAPWGGYTWDERLFPFPGDVMGLLGKSVCVFVCMFLITMSR